MSVTSVEAQTARWKHRMKEPNSESDGDGDDMETDILQHAHA